MKKIPCLFVREFKDNHTFTITDQVTPGCEWVLAGEGWATKKYDGTAVLVKEEADGFVKPYKRYDAKGGKTPPADFLPAQPEPDPVTKHWPGWVPISSKDPSSKWHALAWNDNPELAPGTYELCGPHFQANPDNFRTDTFVRHGSVKVIDFPRSFEGIREYLKTFDGEGVVFHHPDGRMAKIRRDDFGYPWPPDRK